MALGPAASTPVQHPTQHAVKNPSHLPAVLAPNTPSPYSPTTRSWCEITGQDQASAHQVKRRCRRGIRYEQPSCNKSPFLQLTFLCAAFITDGLAAVTKQTQSVSELCLRGGWIHWESNSRLQILCFITLSGGQMQQLTWWHRGGVPVPWHRDEQRLYCFQRLMCHSGAQGAVAFCYTISASQVALLHNFCFKRPQNHPLSRTLSLLLTTRFPHFFLSPNKTLSPSVGLWTSISPSWKKYPRGLNIFSYLIRHSNATALTQWSII